MNDQTFPNPDPPPSTDGLVGQTVAGKYKVLAPLARGGMARIYRAEQLPLGRIVALKVLARAGGGDQDPNFQARFFLEAATCAKLKHPNTVTVFDYGQNPDDGTFYMVMEFVDGRTLHDVIRAEGALQPARALRITAEIARSLQEAHGHNVVHRDLKPSNVMLLRSEEGEQVKVLDFGIAKVLQNDKDEGLTLDDRIVGSPRYMSPEQIRNAGLDARTDIYSLGVVLFEMLAGRPPFVKDNALQMLVAHLNDPVPQLGSVAPWPVPEKVEALARRCLAKDPDERPANVAELRKELKEALAGIADVSTTSRMLASDEVLRPPPASVGGDSAPTLDRPREPRRTLVPGAVLAAIAVLLACGAALVTASAVALFVATSGAPPGPVAQPAPIAEPAPPLPSPVAATSVLHLASAPPGAEVFEGATRLGTTPLDIELRESEPARTFEVRHPGHQPETHTQGWSAEPVEATVTLDRTPAPRPRPRPRPDDDGLRIER